MFMQRIRNYPAPGKAADLRAGAEEATRARHADGKRSVVTTVIFGDVQSIDSIVFHDDLAAVQTMREKTQAAPDFEARHQALATNTRQPGLNELWELVVAGPTNSPGPAPRYVLTNTISAAPGNGPAVRAALTEFVTARQKAGSRLSLYASVSGVARFMLVATYASLADLEAQRAALAGTPESEAFFRASSMFAALGNFEIAEILLTNPA